MTDSSPAARTETTATHGLTADQVVLLGRSGALSPDLAAAAAPHLREALRSMAAFVPGAVLRRQIERPTPGQVSGALWDGSVLFADLSGFTALSGHLSTLGKQGAEEISAIINALFGALVAEVHRYGGEVLKFGGDALTVFFDRAALGQDHAPLAARAAIAMQERMVWFRAIETRGGTFSLRLRVGVHSGRIFAAQVGDADHIELVVTGRDINRVALAQEIAEPGEVVISAETLALTPGASAAQRREGFHRLIEAPYVAPSRARRRWEDLLPAEQTPAAALALAERAVALRPFLAHRLPRRFLEAFESAGELRPVTILFANFSDFSSILEQLRGDPDAAAHALNAYYRRAQAAVHRYGGIVNKVDMAPHGDKLMALFGAPAAHENDPERAARCALELHAALDEANAEIQHLLRAVAGVPPQHAPRELSQKIGLNTGVVFAGLVGTPGRHEYTVLGQPVNLAARTMSAAAPGTTVASPATRRQIEGRFALRDLPPTRLKGVPEPVALAEVVAPRAAGHSPQRALARAPLVGRGEEQRRAVDAARAALHGSGRVIALIGDAGAGKSRLIEETIRHLVLQSGEDPAGPDATPAFMIFTAECQSYDQSTPYAVIRTLLGQILNLELYGSDAPAALARLIGQSVPDQARFTPLLGDVLGLPLEETPLTAALSPQQRHDRAQDLIEALVLAEAARQPLVLVVDDLHWCDASSLDLIGGLAAAAARVPLLLMIAYRPDAAAHEPWHDLPNTTRVTVEELPAADAAALVRELLRGDPPDGLAPLIEKAQGNPFFIEEVVRALVESDVLERGPDGWRLTRELDEAAVPDSIEGLIVARLDRLEEHSREVVQVGAVIGRRFAYNVLARIMPRPDLPQRLEDLAQEDLLLAEAEGIAEHDLASLIYLFKHALTRDVAYEAILFARRRELHRRVAREIEAIHAGRLDEQLALLARHYVLAEEWPHAFDYHLRAARLAQQRYANREAITLLERALEIAAKLPPDEGPRTKDESTAVEAQGAARGTGTPAPPASAAKAQPSADAPSSFVLRPSSLIEIHERLGVVRALVGEYDAALARYETALAMLDAMPGAPAEERVRLHHHIARVYEKRGEFDSAFAWVERALAIDATSASDERIRCLLLGAGLHQRQGRYQQSLEWGEQSLALAEQTGRARDQAHALKLLAGTRFTLGDLTQSHALASRCVQLYQQSRDLAGLADAHNDLAISAQELGRLDEARAHFEAGAAIKEQIGDVYGQAMVANNLGSLLLLLGDLDEATRQYQRSLAMFERLGSLYATGVLHMNLGAVQIQRGALAEAADHLARSAELYERAGAEDFLPELERYQADLALRGGDLPEAQRRCEQAIATARRLEARLEEGLTLRTLGRARELLGDSVGAWDTLRRSLAILREAGSPLEIARTLAALAALAPALGRSGEGQAALAEALPAFESIGARRDLDEARAIAHHYGYTL